MGELPVCVLLNDTDEEALEKKDCNCVLEVGCPRKGCECFGVLGGNLSSVLTP